MEPLVAPISLNLVGEHQFGSLRPGDIILIDDFSELRRKIEPLYLAILACPRCGMPGLITYSQYLGSEAVMCGSDACSCRFRIGDRDRLEYLAAS